METLVKFLYIFLLFAPSAIIPTSKKYALFKKVLPLFYVIIFAIMIFIWGAIKASLTNFLDFMDFATLIAVSLFPLAKIYGPALQSNVPVKFENILSGVELFLFKIMNPILSVFILLGFIVGEGKNTLLILTQGLIIVSAIFLLPISFYLKLKQLLFHGY